MTPPAPKLRLVPEEARKMKARHKVRDALMSGALSRPDACARCGKTPPPASDGRSMIHAHHHDYDRPLDVEWLCAKCHRAETPLPAVMGAAAVGETNGQSKLSKEDVIFIRNSTESGPKLSKILGVDRSTINNVRRRRYWRHV